ncbi:MAG: hypothetical protein IPK82_37590 [Polyangiaceae bacterium]|nr:hypothetical protein [Polyangiaceae bacterium]
MSLSFHRAPFLFAVVASAIAAQNAAFAQAPPVPTAATTPTATVTAMPGPTAAPPASTGVPTGEPSGGAAPTAPPSSTAGTAPTLSAPTASGTAPPPTQTGAPQIYPLPNGGTLPAPGADLPIGMNAQGELVARWQPGMRCRMGIAFDTRFLPSG